ncbi:response regulator transcription factor [Pseudoclavibacter caeni]|uniref:Response regulator transcription factor n=1 Tax=Pseudoclavibacter caeni TaxID=908846 RepID=A0A7C8BVJ7_9MICO|nr:response regulator transcription factor [Pseudoclavibacter caeni]
MGLTFAREGSCVSKLVVLTTTDDGVLPALGLLSHQITTVEPSQDSIMACLDADVVLFDARGDLAGARQFCSLAAASHLVVPILLVVTEGGLAALSVDWGMSDFILADAGPAETDARIRLCRRHVDEALDERPSVIRAAGLVIDEASYSAKINGKPLDLTYKEFELLRFLAGRPGRVFTREQLLSEVWGYDYFGGTRTVDVHVRRLRAKLGDLDSLIGTVRNVGYRFNPVEPGAE